MVQLKGIMEILLKLVMLLSIQNKLVIRLKIMSTLATLNIILLTAVELMEELIFGMAIIHKDLLVKIANSVKKKVDLMESK